MDEIPETNVTFDTTYENVVARLSERGRLEWDLAVQREVNTVLQQRLNEAAAEIAQLREALAQMNGTNSLDS